MGQYSLNLLRIEFRMKNRFGKWKEFQTFEDANRFLHIYNTRIEMTTYEYICYHVVWEDGHNFPEHCDFLFRVMRNCCCKISFVIFCMIVSIWYFLHAPFNGCQSIFFVVEQVILNMIPSFPMPRDLTTITTNVFVSRPRTTWKVCIKHILGYAAYIKRRGDFPPLLPASHIALWHTSDIFCSWPESIYA